MEEWDVMNEKEKDSRERKKKIITHRPYFASESDPEQVRCRRI